MWYETLLSFFIGGVLVLFVGWLFSLKTKGIFRLALNTIAGALLLLGLSIFTPLDIPLNPLNALIVGFLGIPGAVLVVVIVYFL